MPIPILLCSTAMYWFWSEIYTTLYDVKSQNCMMMMYSLHSTHSPLSRPSSADKGRTTLWPQMSRWLSYGWCWLLSDRYCIRCHNEIKSPNNNTTQYLQILPSTQLPNASIVLTLLISRWRHFMQKSAAIWWVHTRLSGAYAAASTNDLSKAHLYLLNQCAHLDWCGDWGNWMEGMPEESLVQLLQGWYEEFWPVPWGCSG